MKKKDGSNTGYNKIAAIGEIAAVLFLGAVIIFDAIRINSGVTGAMVLVSMVVTLLLLLPVFRFVKSIAILAFYPPLVLFLFYIGLMVIGGWNSSYFLLVCLCFCGFSCIYLNFRVTLFYIMVQNITVGILIFMGIPILGPGVPLNVILLTWLISVAGALLLLVLTRAAADTQILERYDRNYFRSLLQTTANYIAMVDESKRVVYISKPLAQLAGIEYPELARGRPLGDLFPGRELKLLVDKMLGQKGHYEDNWEFTLNGQKQYFRVFSDDTTGASRGTLININDMTHLAERNEIAVMKDSLKIGLFFMDRNYVIQDQYSRFLEEMLSEEDLLGKYFPDLLAASVSAKELDVIRDYFDMLFDGAFEQSTLDEINPLDELHYESIKTGDKKVFHCGFTTIERNHGEIFALVSVYDITAKIELQQRFMEEEKRRQEEMSSLFELIQVEPGVFDDFQEDMEYEFSRINETLKNRKISTHDALVEIYQSVHAIKSNAVILGLKTFGDKVHSLESKIKEMREQEREVTFEEMLYLAMELEKLFQEKDKFKVTIERIQSFRVGSAEGQKQSEYVLLESLSKTTSRTAEDVGKAVKFVVDDIDPEALEKGPRRVIKEVLVQLIRNSVVHGIETPRERAAKGKDETGVLRLSVKLEGENIHVKLGDDGRGLDFNKIRERALKMKVISKEDADDDHILVKTIFAPGFSTAEDEGIHAGRGIGLNLVRDRVRDVHGSIHVKSKPDKGTIFNILIPIR